MLEDPVMRLAELRIIEDSADIEAQLANTSGCRPILSMLIMARAEASEAIYALYRTDPEDAKAIRALQNDIARYDNMVRWIKEIVAQGIELDHEIIAQEREEVLQALTQSREIRDEAMELGLLDREETDG